MLLSLISPTGALYHGSFPPHLIKHICYGEAAMKMPSHAAKALLPPPMTHAPTPGRRGARAHFRAIHSRSAPRLYVSLGCRSTKRKAMYHGHAADAAADFSRHAERDIVGPCSARRRITNISALRCHSTGSRRAQQAKAAATGAVKTSRYSFAR